MVRHGIFYIGGVMKKRFNFISFVPVVPSLMLVVGVLTVFGACGMKEDGTWMRCHAVQNDLVILGIITTGLFLLGAFGKKMIRIIANLLGTIGSVGIFLLPGIIKPMCMVNTMR